MAGDGHEIWKRDFTGACSLFGVVFREDIPRESVHAMAEALQLFGKGASWGGFESLAISCAPQLKVRNFAKDYGGPLVRLHIGLEDPEELQADLRAGLDASARLAG